MRRTPATLAAALAAALAALFLTPAPPAGARSTVVTRGENQCRQVALTFDAGADSVSFSGIINALQAHGVRSTFFLTRQWVESFPAHAAAIAAAGHEVANHTDTHPHMPQIPESAMRRELRVTESAILSRTGLSPRPLWRPPYGEYNGTVLDVAEQEGYPWTIMWDIDTIDWEHPPVQTIVDRVLNRVQPGSIVLMHLGGRNTAAAVAAMLPELEQRGYMMVTVGEVLGLTRAGADFGGRTVRVQPGDTLFRLAECHNTTVPVLAAANLIADPNLIAVGQRLYIPHIDEVMVRVNGTLLDLAPRAHAIDGRSLVPVRFVAEALGAQVDWDNDLRKATITRGDTRVELIIGSKTALINGNPVPLDVAPLIEEGRTMVPVRFVAESLGAAVGWVQESRVVEISG